MLETKVEVVLGIGNSGGDVMQAEDGVGHEWIIRHPSPLSGRFRSTVFLSVASMRPEARSPKPEAR